MSILDLLSNKDCWYEFLEHKKSSDFFPKREEKKLTKFIEKEEYLPICEKIQNGEAFPLPRFTKINKKFSEKKRMVFTIRFLFFIRLRGQRMRCS